ncbi:hypothetical protein Tco_0025880 [Tanacetum coccineum]
MKLLDLDTSLIDIISWRLLVQKACRGKCEPESLNGVDQEVGYDDDLVLIQNWNDHFFWVDEFVVPANARFNWFSGSNISKDRAPAVSEYNAEHASILITHASPFLRFPEEFLCWVGISHNYLFNKDTYPRFEYESGEGGYFFSAYFRLLLPLICNFSSYLLSFFPVSFGIDDFNAFIRTADPRKHRTVTPLPTSVVRPSGDLSESVEREFGGDVSGSAGRGQEGASVGGYSDAEPIVPVTAGVAAETGLSRAKRPKKKRVVHESGDTLASSHPPKRLRADYGNTSGSVIGVSPLEEGGGHTDSATASALCTVGPSERFVVLSDSSHYSSAKSTNAEVDSLIRSAASVMTAATTVTTFVSAAATTTVALTDVNKDKNVPTPSIFGDVDTSLQEVYIPEWTVTKGFELNDGRSCANMIDHFTPPAFFKTVRGMKHEQLFVEFNVSVARNLSLSSEVRMCAEYNILEKRKWRSLTEERNDLLQVKDKEIKGLKCASWKLHPLSSRRIKRHTGEHEIARGISKIISRSLLKAICLYSCMRLLMAKCLNSSEYMEALRNAFGRAIEKGMQEELTYQERRRTLDVNGPFPLDSRGLDQVVVGSQTLSVALDICHRRVRKMERNLTERLPILKDVFTSIDHPLSVEALTVLPETFIEPPVATPATNVLSTVVIRPTPDSFLLVEDYENPHLAYAVPGGVIPEPRGEGKVEGSNDPDVGDLVLSQLEEKLGMLSLSCYLGFSAFAILYLEIPCLKVFVFLQYHWDMLCHDRLVWMPGLQCLLCILSLVCRLLTLFVMRNNIVGGMLRACAT